MYTVKKYYDDTDQNDDRFVSAFCDKTEDIISIIFFCLRSNISPSHRLRESMCFGLIYIVKVCVCVYMCGVKWE